MEFIKRSSDYALRGLIYMAYFPKGEVFSLDLIVKRVKVPSIFLHKLFQKLCQSKLLISYRGTRGGFSLAKNPATITVREVIEILQGPILLNRCLGKRYRCHRARVCSLRKRLAVFQKKTIDFFSRMTLKDLAKDEKYDRNISPRKE